MTLALFDLIFQISHIAILFQNQTISNQAIKQ